LALNLCVTLRSMGIEADLAFPALPGTKQHTLLETARDRGIEPLLQFRLKKHENPITNFFDARALRHFLLTHPYDIVHCHLDNDHRIALAATRKLRRAVEDDRPPGGSASAPGIPVAGGRSSSTAAVIPAARRRSSSAATGIPIVRTSYEGLGFPNFRRHARLLAGTAYLYQPSQRALEHDHETYGYPVESMQVVPGAVDVLRFDPNREVPDARRWLGIPPDAFVAGIVARMQTHRRYEDFFTAIKSLNEHGIDAHAIVVGRGTHQERVGKAPVRELALGDRVHFPGYVTGENYVGMLKAFDAKVFLVPGSDGTCRAVRESMAMGKPAVVSERGMLPEIVANGVDGFVTDGSPESLVSALRTLARDRALRKRMGQAARAKAVATFSLEAQARGVVNGYEQVLNSMQRIRVPDSD